MAALINSRILILHPERRMPELDADAKALPQLFDSARSLTIPELGPFKNPISRLGYTFKIKRLINNQLGDVDAIISYMGEPTNVAAEALAAQKGIKFIRRLHYGSEFIMDNESNSRPFITSLTGCSAHCRVERHTVSDRVITIASIGNTNISGYLMESLAIARPNTKIQWIPILDKQHPSPLKSAGNLSVNPSVCFLDTLSQDKLDWLMLMDDSLTFPPVELSLSLAAGVPLLITDISPITDVIDDNCAVIFGPDTQKEEFIRGILPYIESDYRSKVLSDGAVKCWKDKLTLDTAAASFIDNLNSLLCQR